MKIEDFKGLMERHDKPVVLLEGRRALPAEHRHQLVALASKLAGALPKAIFRTGNAEGADEAFAEGVCGVDPTRLELVLPRTSMGKNRVNASAKVASLEQVSVVCEEQAIYESKAASPHNARLFEEGYRQGKNKRLAAKATYLLRDALKVIGDPSLGLAPAAAAMFYVDPDDPMAGGTGHTIRVCRQNKVLVITQTEWWAW